MDDQVVRVWLERELGTLRHRMEAANIEKENYQERISELESDQVNLAILESYIMQRIAGLDSEG